MKLFDALKKIKAVHWVYNLVHYRSLIHNRAAYKRYGVKKPLFASVSSKDFPDKQSHAWLDLENSAKAAPGKPGFLEFPEDTRQKILDWSGNGYMILDQVFDDSIVERINSEIETLLASGKISFTQGNKLMFANRVSALIRSVTH